MPFEFATATRIVLGRGTISQAGPCAKELGKRALVVTGRNPGRAAPLLDSLRGHDVSTVIFSVSGEPEIGTIDEGVALGKREKCDIVIGFGGGSVLDTGKAIAAMLANEGELLNYLEVIGRGKALTRSSTPFIAIPTTAGTGSEVTRNAVLGSLEHRVKVSLRSHLMLPRLALVDPEVTYDLPAAITASTGMDALTQLIEPYVCSRANPVVDSLCVEGIRRAARSLRTAVTKGHDPSAREDMSIASLFGGLALANAGLGAVHGLAGPIGGMFPAPHGAVCAALLPKVMNANLRALRQRASGDQAISRYEEIARLLTGDAQATADAGVEWVRNLVDDFQIPTLSMYGVKQGHARELISKARVSSSMKANPIALTDEELREVVERAL
ncbi:MAG: alcohol dehydrogenase [Verrucomicrobia bacterium]|nr:MAG: alcohol dehydrogenase [Verrucomicrobiota bacterium]